MIVFVQCLQSQLGCFLFQQLQSDWEASQAAQTHNNTADPQCICSQKFTSIVECTFRASKAIEGGVYDRRGAVHVGLVSNLGCHLEMHMRRQSGPLVKCWWQKLLLNNPQLHGQTFTSVTFPAQMDKAWIECLHIFFFYKHGYAVEQWGWGGNSPALNQCKFLWTTNLSGSTTCRLQNVISPVVKERVTPRGINTSALICITALLKSMTLQPGEYAGVPQSERHLSPQLCCARVPTAFSTPS